ncbi:Hypothetical predicted protein [Paramuricea clavata]|uniref:Uncharacterized protein n=1 Tax=Paramuricea clavata TaxID=317549 RepID=A0A7D9EBX0_PARCT|nr:Hypothetical predicted protein [Paramuricea clavata]
MGDQKKKLNIPNRQDTSQIDELKTEINNLPKDKPKACEGLIRELNKKISEVNNKSVKERLHSDLKAISFLGLNSELKKMVEDNGLKMEAIQLVLKYVTSKEELGEYFFTHPNGDSEKDGLDAVRRRLSPKLEVLGGLYSKGIDVSKPWVQNLVQAAPSLQTLSRIPVSELQELCDGENQGEKEVVKRLVKDAESRSKQRATAKNFQEFYGKEGGGKAIDHEKLKKAKALMKEAKKLATDQAVEAKNAVNGKLAEITKILQLPRDWNKQDIGLEPEQLLQQFDGIIEQFKSVVEVGEPYQSEMEVVRKASGGRALCGIYYSEYVPPVTAEVPIIVMPEKLILSSPNNSQQVRYVQFSKSQAAADYVQSVKSSSSNIGVGIAGFYKLAVGEFSGSYATKSDKGMNLVSIYVPLSQNLVHTDTPSSKPENSYKNNFSYKVDFLGKRRRHNGRGKRAEFRFADDF